MLLHNYMGKKIAKVEKRGKGNILKEKSSLLDNDLRDRCKAINWGVEIEKLSYQNEEEKELVKDMLGRMENILTNPLNYYGDLYAAIYLAYLHNNPTYDCFGMNVGSITIDSERDREGHALLSKLEEQIYEIGLIWNSDDKKFNKAAIRENYLKIFSGKQTQSYEGEYKITSIPGGCFLYHATMISKEHIGLFDLEKNTEDYKRYAFGKSHMIYERLKYGPVENRLLMEYTLGIGYLNQIYPYIKLFDLKDEDEIEGILNLIEMSIKYIPFFLRGKITRIIWEYIVWDDLKKSRIENVNIILSDIALYIMNLYQDTLKQWWEIFQRYAREDDWRIMEMMLQREWEAYFTEDEVYGDWIKDLKLHDWRGIAKVEDCFAVIKSFVKLEKRDKREELAFFESPKLSAVQVEDRTGKSEVLFLEAPINKIGEEVHEEAVKRLSRKRFPEDIADLYSLYYNMRKDTFNKMQKYEEGEFIKKEVKIKEEYKKLKPEQKYAWLHKYVIQWLIQIRINADEK